jgi:flagellar M-ring protein FliF
VVDGGGHILSGDRQGEGVGGASSAALQYQASFERQLDERVESMLGAVVGRDKVIARVAATLDFARVERTEETYDPDRSALRTQRTTREPAASAQARSTESDSGGADPEGPRREQRDESQTYEISKVVSHTILPAGVVKQLSVALLIDGTYTGTGAARKFTPRPAEEIDRLKELVKGAVGFSEVRGDRIDIASVPFQAEVAGPEEGVLVWLGGWLPPLLLRLVALAFAAAVLFYVVRPLVEGLAVRGAGEARPSLPEAAVAQLTQENLALTQRNPERAAQLVREWLSERTPAIEG